MGLFDFMKKKKDDFSLSDDSFNMNGNSDSYGSSFESQSKQNYAESDTFGTDGLPPFDSPVQSSFDSSHPLSNASYLGPDSVSTPPPDHSGSNQSSSFEYPLSKGQQMAREYVSKEHISSDNSSSSQAHTLEMVNVKLDAIRSSLDAMNQRVQHIEQIIQNNKRW